MGKIMNFCYSAGMAEKMTDIEACVLSDLQSIASSVSDTVSPGESPSVGRTTWGQKQVNSFTRSYRVEVMVISQMSHLFGLWSSHQINSISHGSTSQILRIFCQYFSG